jgi:hypothetical protein
MKKATISSEVLLETKPFAIDEQEHRFVPRQSQVPLQNPKLLWVEKCWYLFWNTD